MTLASIFENRPYPGRFLILGQIQDTYVAIYGVTARSISSKAKRYILSPDKTFVTVEATDAEIMAQGDLDLLQYNAVYFFDNGLVIGNGRQTDAVKNLDREASEMLLSSLKDQSFEPDKYNTPRITGCIVSEDSQVSAALHIIRSDENYNPIRDVFEVPLQTGKAKLISTYNGPNTRPTPSFEGGALDIDIISDSLQSFVKEVYDALSPKPVEEDLRVSVVGVSLSQDVSQKETFILNSV
jgi:IMP cyclohydrolase